MPVKKNITPVRTWGSLCGSFMASVIGMISPIPSKENTAVLKSVRLGLEKGDQDFKTNPMSRGK